MAFVLPRAIKGAKFAARRGISLATLENSGADTTESNKTEREPWGNEGKMRERFLVGCLEARSVFTTRERRLSFHTTYRFQTLRSPFLRVLAVVVYDNNRFSRRADSANSG